MNLARRLLRCRALGLLVLSAILTGSFCEGKNLLGGCSKLKCKTRGLLEHSKVHGGVVELEKDVAQLFIVLLELLDTPLEGLDGILLSTSIGSLC